MLCRRHVRRGRRSRCGRCRRRLAVRRALPARRSSAPAPSRAGSALARSRRGCDHGWGLGGGSRAAAPPPSRSTLSRGFGGPLDGRRGLPEHAGSNLAFGAKRPVRRVDIDPPDSDCGWRTTHRRTFLSQRPARVYRLARLDRLGELPVDPLPGGDLREGHVHGPQPDRGRDQKRRWGEPGVACGSVDREGREVSGERGE